MASKDMERRTMTFEVRVDKVDDKDPVIRGHAAVFNEEADIGGYFREVVKPGAFRESIKIDDVRALFNHDPNFVLGRNKAGTLRMSEDKEGLAIEIDPPDTQTARDLMVSMERGDISQMSFGFNVLEEKWITDRDSDSDLRELHKVRLFDVSPVTYPAYEGTDVAVRSWEAYKKQETRQSINNKKKKLFLIEEDSNNDA